MAEEGTRLRVTDLESRDYWIHAATGGIALDPDEPR